MNFIDIILDTIHDTWAMLPLLYITYCILEVFERKNTQDDKLFFGLQRLGPILGAIVGLIPQCGFSILAAMLFVQNNITLGTLVSVMIGRQAMKPFQSLLVIQRCIHHCLVF